MLTHFLLKQEVSHPEALNLKKHDTTIARSPILTPNVIQCFASLVLLPSLAITDQKHGGVSLRNIRCFAGKLVLRLFKTDVKNIRCISTTEPELQQPGQLSTWWPRSNVYKQLQINKWRLWNDCHKQSLHTFFFFFYSKQLNNMWEQLSLFSLSLLHPAAKSQSSLVLSCVTTQ